MFTALFILAIFLVILVVGGFVADCILPNIKPLERWMDNLEKTKYSRKS